MEKGNLGKLSRLDESKLREIWPLGRAGLIAVGEG